jgi:hypothetical protein
LPHYILLFNRIYIHGGKREALTEERMIAPLPNIYFGHCFDKFSVKKEKRYSCSSLGIVESGSEKVSDRKFEWLVGGIGVDHPITATAPRLTVF